MPDESENNVSLMDNTATKYVKQLWGGIKPPIHIIYEAWDAQRWNDEIKKMELERRKDIDIHSVLKKLNDSDKSTIADWLVSIGPLVTTGDLFALQYILLMIVNMYNSNVVKLHDAWRTEAECKDGNKDSLKFLTENIVLIGGPSGNPITYRLLEKLGVLSLFPDAPDNDLRIRKWGKEEYMSPTIKDNENNSDCGLFLYGKNPWGTDTSFFAPMGSLSWGTQAAGALACYEEGAKMLIKAKDELSTDPFISDYSWLKGIGYVNVIPKDSVRLPKLVVPDCYLKMVWPTESTLHSNPKSILMTGYNLKKEQLFENIYLQKLLDKKFPASSLLHLSLAVFFFSFISIIGWYGYSLHILHPLLAIPICFAGLAFSILSFWRMK